MNASEYMNEILLMKIFSKPFSEKWKHQFLPEKAWLQSISLRAAILEKGFFQYFVVEY
jgi:hypothetical protein